MKTNALAELKPAEKAIERAQFEAFEFELEAGTPGSVRVTNASYGTDKDDHSYVVEVENGIPTACTCPADEYHDGACKHRVAVAIRNPVLEAANRGSGAQKAVALADGGVVLEESEPEADACPNGQVGCGGSVDDLPCWTCYQEVSR